MSNTALDVCIVGAGPGGLAAANAIRVAAPKLKVAVYERCSAMSRRGAGLGLDINGQKALKAIEPALHKELLQQASFLRTQRVMSKDGKLISESPLSKARQEYEQQGYKTPCLLGWYEIQQMFYRQLQGEVTVHLGADFDRYEEDPGSGLLTVHFRGGTQPPVQTSLLVASDGYFSRVRRQCVNDGAPAYGNSMVWRARLPAASAVAAGLDLQGSSAFLQDTGRFLFAFPISSGDYVWTVGVSDEKLAEHGLDPSSILEHLRTRSGKQQSDYVTGLDTQGYTLQDAGRGEAARARCLQAMSGFGDSVLRIIAETPGASLVEHGVYVRPADAMTPQAYGKGRVLIIGDAAHPVRPTGQGLNQAMEDCWGLGKAVLGAHQIGPAQLDRLQQFRQTRAARVKTVVAVTTAAGEAAYKDGAKQEERREMAPEEFIKFLYEVEFDSLAGMLATV